MYDIIEITRPDDPPGQRTIVISDPMTHLAFTLGTVRCLNVDAFESMRRRPPVALHNGQLADAMLQVAARLACNRADQVLAP